MFILKRYEISLRYKYSLLPGAFDRDVWKKNSTSYELDYLFDDFMNALAASEILYEEKILSPNMRCQVFTAADKAAWLTFIQSEHAKLDEISGLMLKLQLTQPAANYYFDVEEESEFGHTEISAKEATFSRLNGKLTLYGIDLNRDEIDDIKKIST